MRDKYTAGLLAGFLAGAVCLTLQCILSGVFHLGRCPQKEFAGLVMLMHVPSTPAENALAVGVHLIFCAFMGGIFAYFLELVSSRYDLIKGILFGLITGGAIWAMTFLVRFRPEGVSNVTNALVDCSSAAVFGLTLAILYRHFYRKDRSQA